MNLIRRWKGTDPTTSLGIQNRNFLYVQMDAVAIGLANAAAPFLPVFLTRLGATSVQVGLLTSMPALTGLLFSIIIGNFLQSRRNIVPWFSWTRLLTISGYTLTGLAPFFVPEEYIVQAILVVWAVVTIPQVALNVSFNVVMNGVAGPERRYDLMSRRWSTLGATTAIGVVLVGQFLSHTDFPINYQIAFITLSSGGLISFFITNKIQLPDSPPPAPKTGLSLWQRAQEYASLIRGQRAFLTFTSKRFVFLSGVALAAPLFPLFYVRVLGASDASIGLISTSQTAVVLFGYYLWTRQSRVRGSRFVLLWTTFGLSLYPALVSMTRQVEVVIVLAATAGIFQAGMDLVFFDELMKTVPARYTANFVSFAQSMQYFSAVIAPLVGTYLADQIGIPGALMVSSGIRFMGFLLFLGLKPLAGVRSVAQKLRAGARDMTSNELPDEGNSNLPAPPPPDSPSRPE